MLADLAVRVSSVQDVLAVTKELIRVSRTSRSRREASLRLERPSPDISPKRSWADLRAEFDQAVEERVGSNWCVTARNCLMCLLLSTNSSRPGPLLNMTMRELEEIEEIEHDQLWVIHVDAHKTSKQFGPAGIFLRHPDKLRLERYVSEVRPLLAENPTGDFVFETKQTVHSEKGAKGGDKMTNDCFCQIQRRVLGHNSVCKRKQDSEKFKGTEHDKNVSDLQLHSFFTHQNVYQKSGALKDQIMAFTARNKL